jgi:hypothetical protein
MKSHFGRLAAGLLLFVSMSWGQAVTASIVGQVFDPSGAPIAQAKVRITASNLDVTARTAVTDETGAFVATLLPIGIYSVRVEAPGFKASSRSGIELHVSDRLGLRFDMEVGAITESVTVEANAVVIDTQSPTSAGLISGTEVRELSLNNRNYIQLISLMPGVTSNAATDEVYVGTTNPLGGTNTIPFSISGGRTSGNNMMVDGADNVDRGSNLTLLNYPSVDAIAEFKALRGQYSAEYGRGATGMVNVITKSGTKDIHGSAYEFFRNDKLAANNFFNNLRIPYVPRPPLRYNNFGYTIGGPIPIGNMSRTTNKTYFFWSNEFRRVITYSTFQSTVPTPDMKNGIFPTPVCIQRTGSTCLQTASTIPSTSISTVAKQYLGDIWSKVPSAATGTTLFSPQKSLYDGHQELLKIDHTINEHHNLSVRYIHDAIPTEEPGGLFTGAVIPGVATTKSDSPGTNWTARATSTISTTLYNEAGYSFSYGAIISRIKGLMGKDNSPNIKPALPFPSTLARVPTITLNGGSSLAGFGPYDDYNRNHNIFDNLSKFAGKHTIKTGFAFNMYQKIENAGGNNAGTFAFTPAVTPTGTAAFSQSFANFLLGDVATYTQASLDLTPDMRQRQWELYVQDDFRMRTNFTLNFGVRYSNYYAPYDMNNYLTNFDPSKYDPSKAVPINPANGNIVLGSGDPENGIIVNGKNSPYGKKVSNEDLNKFAPRIGFAWDPKGKGKTAIRSGYGISYDSTLVGIYEQNIFANPPFVSNISISNTNFENPGSVVASVSAATKAIRGTPLPYQHPYTQQWSFDLQQALGQSTTVTAGYYGSKSTHLLGIVDLNTLPAGFAAAAGLQPGNNPLTSANTPLLNAIRPYRGYNAVNTVQNWFDSNYHSLQMNMQKQFGDSGYVRASYTWSKTLTNASSDRSDAPQNPYNRAAEKARASFDRTQVFSLSYYYTLPFGGNLKGWKGGIAKGWRISGITAASTGLPLAVTSSASDPGGLGIIGSSTSALRPDMVSDPNTNAPKTIAEWFNKAAFAAVPAGQVRPGNAPRRYAVGPGLSRWDLSLFKTVKVQERYALQIRFETFNTLNHTNFQGVGVAFTTPTTFGTITSTRDPRRVQLAMKFTF